MKKQSISKKSDQSPTINHLDESCWAVVTVQQSDGYDQDGYFIATSKGQVISYAKSVSPNMVYVSYYPTLDEAEEFVDANLDGYIKIDSVVKH
jgi:hypothetical protein